jgi:hypothetical protein
MRNTADVTGGKPIAVLLQCISGVRAINPLVAFYDIHGGKREVLFFYFVPDTTRDRTNYILSYWRIVDTFASYTCIYLRSSQNMPNAKMQVNQMLCYLLAWQIQVCQLEYTHVSRWHVKGACIQLCQLQSCVFPP